MININWDREHARFMAVAYGEAIRAARKAFRRWPESKRDDATAEFVGKVWDTWSRRLSEGQDPAAILRPILHFAKMWVRYDRRIAGRPRNVDIADHRAKMTRHLLDGRGRPEPHDRSARINHFLDWSGRCSREDDPAATVAALDAVGMCLDDL